MKIQTPPGMRDFYPEDMRLQNWLFDHWRQVSLTHGFEEYEAPIFEFLDLYRLKSGDEIVSELFNFEDRGGRSFAIRPEMTPSLARMVAARANALPRPIKWFSIPRMCRAERPQRGRLREFFQWNADVLGPEDPLADAEVIAVVVAFLRAVGCTADEAVVRVNHRRVAAAALQALGVPEDGVVPAFALLDKIERMPEDKFAAAWGDLPFASACPVEKVRGFLAEATFERCCDLARESGEQGAEQAEQFALLWRQLEAFGVAEMCAFDVRIVRGLAYYTGSVFEAHAKDGALRALCGGGRYDDLTGLLGGPRVSGVGFGMGDVPMIEFLRDQKRLPDPQRTLDVFVIDAAEDLFPKALELVGILRAAGLSVDFSYKRAGVGKQFKQATQRNAKYAVVLGDELRASNEVVVKDLGKGEQRTVAWGDVVAAVSTSARAK